jgi:acyl-[acyl carrier protein]--UDP-N-acetylglucosamine O-acyltransferase
LGTNVDYTKIREERRWHRTPVKKKYTKSSTVVIIGHQKRIKEPTVVANKKEHDCTSGEDKNDSVFPVTIKDEFIEDKKKKIT